MISERIKAAMAVAKAKGKKRGLAKCSKAWQQRVTALGHAAIQKAALERAEAYRLHVEWAFRQPNPYSNARPISFNRAANVLNARNIESPMGRRWTGPQLHRMGIRLKLNHPLSVVPTEVKEARVRAICKEQSEITAMQLMTCVRRRSCIAVSRGGLERGGRLERRVGVGSHTRRNSRSRDAMRNNFGPGIFHTSQNIPHLGLVQRA